MPGTREAHLLQEIAARIGKSAVAMEHLVAQPATTATATGLPEGRDEEESAAYEAVRLACREVEDHVLDLSSRMPEGIQDYDLRILLQFMAELRRAVEDLAAGIAKRGAIELQLMKVRDVIGRLERRLRHTRWETPDQAIKFIFEVLDGVQTAELVRLLGVSDKTITTWRKGGPPRTHASRVVLTAQLLSYLQPTLTTRGLLMWFDTKFEALGGKSPIELLEHDAKAAWVPLISFARGGRDQLGD